MKRFSDYLIEQEDKPAVWHASKDEIVAMWKNLKPSPIMMEPIPENQKGTRLANDGLRITGSAMFVNAVLSRVKDLLEYETQPGTRLDVEYRQIETKQHNAQQRYLCYIHVEQDSKKKPKGFQLPEPEAPSHQAKIKLAKPLPMTPPI